MQISEDIIGDHLDVELFAADVEPLCSEQQRRVLSMISDKERRRAGRFRHEPSKRCYLAARRLVRETLMKLGGRSPDSWRFSSTEHGRPFLQNPTGALEGVDFNLSHSTEKVVLAVVRTGRVGVDLEPTSRRVDHELVAQKFFHPRERKAIAELPPHRRRRRFLQLWVLKEALLKADGRGIGGGLNRVVLCFEAQDQPRLVQLPDGDPACWQIALAEFDDHLLGVARQRVQPARKS